MKMDELKTIDDSALEAVSGGHGGHIKEIVEGAIKVAHKVEDLVGGGLEAYGDLISAIGKRISSHHE